MINNEYNIYYNILGVSAQLPPGSKNSMKMRQNDEQMRQSLKIVKITFFPSAQLPPGSKNSMKLRQNYEKMRKS